MAKNLKTTLTKATRDHAKDATLTPSVNTSTLAEATPRTYVKKTGLLVLATALVVSLFPLEAINFVATASASPATQQNTTTPQPQPTQDAPQAETPAINPFATAFDLPENLKATSEILDTASPNKDTAPTTPDAGSTTTPDTSAPENTPAPDSDTPKADETPAAPTPDAPTPDTPKPDTPKPDKAPVAPTTPDTPKAEPKTWSDIAHAIGEGTLKGEGYLPKLVNGVYQITTPEAFAWWAYLHADTPATLTQDINLTERENITWLGDAELSATFNGAGHAITFKTEGSGLFARVLKQATVKNLELKGEGVSTKNSRAGSVAGENNGTITSIINRAPVNATNTEEETFTAGIAGYNTGTITDAANLASVQSKATTQNSATAGIAAAGTGTIKTSYTAADILAAQNGAYLTTTIGTDAPYTDVVDEASCYLSPENATYEGISVEREGALTSDELKQAASRLNNGRTGDEALWTKADQTTGYPLPSFANAPAAELKTLETTTLTDAKPVTETVEAREMLDATPEQTPQDKAPEIKKVSAWSVPNKPDYTYAPYVVTKQTGPAELTLEKASTLATMAPDQMIKTIMPQTLYVVLGEKPETTPEEGTIPDASAPEQATKEPSGILDSAAPSTSSPQIPETNNPASGILDSGAPSTTNTPQPSTNEPSGILDSGAPTENVTQPETQPETTTPSILDSASNGTGTTAPDGESSNSSSILDSENTTQEQKPPAGDPVAVTWTIEYGDASAPERTLLFKAVLPEGYAMADGVEAPAIKVIITEEPAPETPEATEPATEEDPAANTSASRARSAIAPLAAEPRAGTVVATGNMAIYGAPEVNWSVYNNNGTYSLDMTGSGTITKSPWSSKDAARSLWRAYNLTSATLALTVRVQDYTAWFAGCTQFASFTGSFAYATTTSGMFYNCARLTSFSESLPYVTNTSEMFYGCTRLTSFAGSLAKVRDTSYMFHGCVSLKSLSSAKLTASSNTNYMFFGCTSLKELPSDLAIQVGLENLEGMFQNTNSLMALPSGFTLTESQFSVAQANLFKIASSLNSPSIIYSGTGPLASADYWATQNRRLVANMVAYGNLPTVDNVGWAMWTLNNEGILEIYGDGTVEDLGWTASNAATGYWGPYRSQIESVTLSANITRGDYWFYNCTALVGFHGSLTWDDKATVKSTNHMFDGCKRIGGFEESFTLNISTLTSADYMFSGCTSMMTLPSYFLFSPNIVSTEGTFQNCVALMWLNDELSLGTKHEKVKNMFKGCAALKEIPGYLQLSSTSITDVTSMFEGCSSIEEIYSLEISSSITTFNGMFKNTSSLEELPATMTLASDQVKAVMNAGDVFKCDGSPKKPMKYKGKNRSLSSPDFWVTQDRFYSPSGVLPTVNSQDKVTWELNEQGVLLIKGAGRVTAGLFNGSTNDASDYWGSYRDRITSVSLASTVTTPDFSYWFANCPNLTTLASGFVLDQETLYTNFMFLNCTSLQNLPESFVPELGSFLTQAESMFEGCTSLKALPSGFIIPPNLGVWKKMFYHSGLKALPEGFVFSQAQKNVAEQVFVHNNPGEEIYYAGGNGVVADVRFWGDQQGRTLVQGGSLPMVDGAGSCLWKLTDNKLVLTPSAGAVVRGDLWSSAADASTKYWGPNREYITAVTLNGAAAQNYNYWFYGCKNLTNVTGTFASTAKGAVSAFEGCSKLTKASLPDFAIPAELTDASYMFKSCVLLDEVPLGAAFPSKLEKATGMFDSCGELKTLPSAMTLPTTLTNSAEMFKNCTKLASLSSGFTIPASVTNWDSMFYHTDALTKLPSGFGFSTEQATAAKTSKNVFKNSTSKAPMTYGGTNAEAVKIDFWTSQDRTFTLGGDLPLTGEGSVKWTLDADGKLSIEGTGTVASFEGDGLPWYGHRATIVSVSIGEEVEAVDYRNWFRGCSSLTSFSGELSKTATSTDFMFKSCAALKSLPGGFTIPESTTDTSSMFEGCESLESLPAGFTLSDSVVSAVAMFKGCTTLEALPEGFTLPKGLTDWEGMFYYSGLKYLPSTFSLTYDQTYQIEGGGYFESVTDGEPIYYSGTDSYVLDPGLWLDGAHRTLVIGGILPVTAGGPVTWTLDINEGISQRSLLISGTGTVDTLWENKEDSTSAYWGAYRQGFSSVTIPSTVKAENYNYWFSDFVRLTTFYGSLASTATGTKSMFSGCAALTSLPSNFAIPSSATDVSSMFDGCSFLREVPFNFAIPNGVVNASSMFKGCAKLSSLPGGFTLPAAVTNVSSLFEGCALLVGLPTNFVLSSNITNTSSMFEGCAELRKLPEKFALYSSTTDISKMLKGCTKLVSLPEGFLLPEGVLNSSSLFANCTSLSSLPADFTIPVSVTNWDSMFYHTDALEILPTNFAFSEAQATLATTSKNVFACSTQNKPIYYVGTNATVANADFWTGQSRELLKGGFLPTTKGGPVTWGISSTGALALKGTGTVDTLFSSASNGNSFYWGPYRSFITSTSIASGVVSANYDYWFNACKNLTSFEGALGASATSAANMFSNCSKLETLPTSFSIPNTVTITKNMFATCAKLNNLPSTLVLPTAATDVSGMFSDCAALSGLPASFTITSSVENASNMFSSCSALSQLPTNFALSSSVTNASGMFKSCAALTGLPANFTIPSGVTNLRNMFSDCSLLASLPANFTIAAGTASVLRDLDSMFSKCIALTELPKNFTIPEGVTVTSYMFDGCTALASLPAGFSLPSSVATWKAMFRNTNVLEFLPTSFTLSQNQVDSAQTEQNMFLCESEPNKPIYYMGDCALIKTQDFWGTQSRAFRMGDRLPTTAGGSVTWDINSTGKLSVRGSGTVTGLWSSAETATTGYWGPYRSLITSVDIENTVGVQNYDWWFYNCTSLAGSNLALSSIATSTKSMFSGCTSLKILGASFALPTKATDVSSMFEGCTALATITTPLTLPTGVTTTQNMFKGCTSLASLPTNFVITANVTTTQGMFSGCTALASLPASFSIPGKVTNTTSMFENCSALTALPTNFKLVEGVTAADSMFSGCTTLASLPSGFTIPASIKTWTKMFYHTNALEYLPTSFGFSSTQAAAATDTFKCTTSKKAMYYDGVNASVSSATWWLNNQDRTLYIGGKLPVSAGGPVNWIIDSAGKLSLSGVGTVSKLWASSSVAATNYWGSRRASITSVDIGADVKAQDFGYWFYNCTALKSVTGGLTLPASYTSATATSMFQGCTTLDTLPAGFAVPSGVTNTASMFEGCSKLASLPSSFVLPTSGITNTSSMFKNCTKLASLPDSFTIPSSVTSWGSMFYHTDALVTLPANFGFSAAQLNSGKTDGDVFRNSTAKAVITYGGTNAQALDKTFWTAQSRELLVGTTLPTSSGTVTWRIDINNKLWIEGAGTVSTLWTASSDIAKDHWGPKRATITAVEIASGVNAGNYDYWFSNCASLSSFTGTLTSTATSTAFMFSNCSVLASLPDSFRLPTSITNANSMFASCSTLVSLPEGFTIPASLTTWDKMFYYANSLEFLPSTFAYTAKQGLAATNTFRCATANKPIYYSGVDATVGTNMSWSTAQSRAFYTGGKLPVTGTGTALWKIDSAKKLSIEGSATVSELFGSTSDATTKYWGPHRSTVLSASIASGTNAANYKYWFYNCGSLASFTGALSASATSTASMFANCAALVSLPTTLSVPASTTNADSMFEGCSSLAGLPDVFTIPSGLTSWTKMFFNTAKLEMLPKNFKFTAAQKANATQTFDFTDGSAENTRPIYYSGGDSVVGDAVFWTTQHRALSTAITGWLPADEGAQVISWKLDSGKLTIEGTGTVQDLGFTPTLGTKYWDPYRDSITSVEIASTVQAKNYYRWFYNCTNLVSFTGVLSESVTDFSYMFAGCSSLTSLSSGFTIPSGATTVGHMFDGCAALPGLPSGFSLPDSLTNITALFYNCTSLKSLPEGFKIPAKVNLWTYAFRNTDSLEVLPNSFSIPSTLAANTEASQFVFTCTPDKPIYYNGTDAQVLNADWWTNKASGRILLANKNGSLPITPGSGTGVTWKVDANDKLWIQGDGEVAALFSGPIATSTANTYWNDFRGTILAAEIGSGVRAVDYSYWFYNCKKMTSFSGALAGTPTKVNSFFNGCTSLTTFPEGFTIPESVTDISYLFSNCTSFTTLPEGFTIPESVTDISSFFSGCTSLTTLPEGFAIPEGVTSAYSFFLGCTSLTTLPEGFTIPESVTSARVFFANCTSLTTLPENFTIPENVTDLVSFFQSCTSLTTLPENFTIPENVTDLSAMFFSCSSLVKLPEGFKIPSSVTKWGSMFNGTTSLEVLPNSFSIPAKLASDTTADMNVFTCTPTGKPIYYSGTDTQVLNADWWTNKAPGRTLIKNQSGVLPITADSGTGVTWKIDSANKLWIEGNGEVVSLFPDGASNTEYWGPFRSTITAVSIGANVKAVDYNYWFSSCSELTAVEGTLAASATSTLSMFEACAKLSSLSAGFTIPTEATEVSNMFAYCTALKGLPDNFKLSEKATNTTNMFNNCMLLEKLPAGFTIPDSVLDAIYMFAECSSLKELPSGFTLSAQLESAEGMFMECSSLASLPDGFTIPESVTSWDAMFQNTNSLEILPDSFSFSTALAAAGKASNVFTCSTPNKPIYYSGKNIGPVIDPEFWKSQSRVLGAGGKLPLVAESGTGVTWKIDADGKLWIEGTGTVSNLWGDTSGYTQNYWGPYRDTIKSISIGANVKATDYKQWFRGCPELTSFEGTLNTAATSVINMFRDCPKLASLPEGLTVPTSATTAASMFQGCTKLAALPAGFTLPAATTSMVSMFQNCTSLTGLPKEFVLPTTGTGAGSVDASSMFEGCTKLSALSETFTIPSSVGKWDAMFHNTNSLEVLPDSFGFSSTLASKTGVFKCDSQSKKKVYYKGTDSQAKLASFWTNQDRTLVTDGKAGILPTTKGSAIWRIDENNKLWIEGSGIVDSLFSDSNYATLYWGPYRSDIKEAEIASGVGAVEYAAWFRQCLVLEKFTGTLSDSATSTRYMFYKCPIKGLPDTFRLPARLTTASAMFLECASLEGLPAGFTIPDNVTDCSYMFYRASALSALPAGFKLSSKVTNCASMFNGCTNLASLPEGFTIPESITAPSNWNSMFRNTTSLEVLPNSFTIPQALATGTVAGHSVFTCDGITGKPIYYGGTAANIPDATWWSTNASGRDLVLGKSGNLPIVEGSGTGVTWKIDKNNKLWIEGSGIVDSLFSDSNYATLYWGPSRSTIKEAEITSGVGAVDYTSWFRQCSVLEKFTGTLSDSAKSTRYMFNNCSKLKGLSDTFRLPASLTNAGSMFLGCTSLEGLPVGFTIPDKVTDCSYMFCNASALSALPAGFKLSSQVTNCALMFSGCTKLASLPEGFTVPESIITPDKWRNMFYNTKSLEVLPNSFTIPQALATGTTASNNVFTCDGEAAKPIYYNGTAANIPDAQWWKDTQSRTLKSITTWGDVGALVDSGGIPNAKPTGTGTTADPYKIGTAEALAWFAYKSISTDGLCANLTANIDLGGTSYVSTGLPWIPVRKKVAYTGTIDGQGFTISNMLITEVSGGVVGLVGYLCGSVKNLSITKASISGTGKGGGIAGAFGVGGAISNCSVTESSFDITGRCVGAITGDANWGGGGKTISNVYEHSNTGRLDGGLVGEGTELTISNSYSASATATQGIVGPGGLGATASRVYCVAPTTLEGSTCLSADELKGRVDIDPSKKATASVLGGFNVIDCLNSQGTTKESYRDSRVFRSSPDSVNGGYPVFATTANKPTETTVTVASGDACASSLGSSVSLGSNVSLSGLQLLRPVRVVEGLLVSGTPVAPTSTISLAGATDVSSNYRLWAPGTDASASADKKMALKLGSTDLAGMDGTSESFGSKATSTTVSLAAAYSFSKGRTAIIDAVDQDGTHREIMVELSAFTGTKVLDVTAPTSTKFADITPDAQVHSDHAATDDSLIKNRSAFPVAGTIGAVSALAVGTSLPLESGQTTASKVTHVLPTVGSASQIAANNNPITNGSNVKLGAKASSTEGIATLRLSQYSSAITSTAAGSLGLKFTLGGINTSDANASKSVGLRYFIDYSGVYVGKDAIYGYAPAYNYDLATKDLSSTSPESVGPAA